MPIRYQDIRTERQWRAATGLTQPQFETLTRHFREAYEDTLGETIEQSATSMANPPTFTTYEDLLFFLLYSIKSGLTYDLIALCFDINLGSCFRTQAFGLRILQAALRQTGDLPKRMYSSVDEFDRDLAQSDEVLIDATEQPRQRAVNQADQKEDYSGKKKHIR